MRSLAAHKVAGTLAVVLLTTGSPAAAADCGGAIPCSCGDRLTADRTLTAADPIASGICSTSIALDVEPGVTLSLGGQTITGAPGLLGVTLDDASKLFGPGTIAKFTRGVIGLTGSNGIVVADVTTTLCTGNGFDFVSDGNTFEDNSAIGNGGDGIFVIGSNNIVVGNVLKNNGARGAFVGGFGYVDNVVRRNRVAGNAGNGLYIVTNVVSATGDNVSKNRIKGAADGVTTGVGLRVDSGGGTGNSVHGNTVKRYATGIQVSGTMNQVSSNSAKDGGTGFLLSASTSQILGNQAVGNEVGFQISGNENTFQENVAKKSVATGTGFAVTGSKNTFEKDSAIKNAGVGFVLPDVAAGDGNTLTETRAKRNGTCQYQIGDNNIDGGDNKANKDSISFGASGGDFCP